MADLGAEFIKIAPLDLPQGVSNPVQFPVLRGMNTDIADRAAARGVDPFPAGAVAGRPEAAEPDAGRLARSPAPEPHPMGLQPDAEQVGDRFEILKAGVEPLVAEARVAVSGTGAVPGGIRQLVQAIDKGFDDLRHGGRLRQGGSTATRRC